MVGGGPRLRRRWAEGGAQVWKEGWETHRGGRHGLPKPVWRPVQPAHMVILTAVTWLHLPALTFSSRAQPNWRGRGTSGQLPAPQHSSDLLPFLWFRH